MALMPVIDLATLFEVMARCGGVWTAMEPRNKLFYGMYMAQLL